MTDRPFVSFPEGPDYKAARPDTTRSFLPQAVVVPAADATSIIAAVAVAGGSRLSFAYGALAYLALASTGSQRLRIDTAVGCDVPWLLARLSVPMLLLGAIALTLGAPAASLAQLVGVASAAAVLVAAGRAIASAAIRAARRRGRLLGRVVIVGAGEVGVDLATALTQHPEYGLVPAGLLDTSHNGHRGAAEPWRDGVTVLAGPASLASMVERAKATGVIIAGGTTNERELAAALRACESLPVELYVVPRLLEFGIAPAGLLADDVWGIPLIRLRRPALRPAARLAKRVFDVLVAGAALLVSAPVLLVAAVAVRCSSPGPTLFRQRRLGQHGRPFELFKFRTMAVNGDSDVTWSVAGDARVTRVGRFLRRWCIDELPQLLNVLRGEMSLVGPRPERPFFARRFADRVPSYDSRHRAPAGMTGWAQVHGLRGDTPIRDRVRFDNYYIEHWSLWLDIVVLARTASSVIANRC